MKLLFIKILLVSIGIVCIAQADSLIRIKCDDQDVGTKVYFNNKLAGECPFDKFIPEGKVSIKAHKTVDNDYEQFFSKNVYAAEGGIQKIELEMSPAQLTPDAKHRVEEAQARQKILDEQQKQIQIEQQAAAKLKAENAKGVFINKETNLMWQDDEDAKTVQKDWQGAVDYCQNLTLADYDDWKLPDKDTLLALYPKKDALQNIKSDVGMFSTPSSYWSLSDDNGNSQYAYYVGFKTGIIKFYYKFGTLYTRCVRDNK